MAAPILSVHPESPQPRVVERAVTVLEAGGLIAYPTDTAYAFGCSLGSKKGLERLRAYKGGGKKPFALICPDLSDVARYAHVSNDAYRVLRRNTPGPFVFVLEATRLVPDLMMTRQKQVGIRVPDLELPRALSRGLGRPLVTTTATTAEGEVLRDGRDIKDQAGEWLELILDAGPLPDVLSTVVSLIDDVLEIVREGKGELV